MSLEALVKQIAEIKGSGALFSLEDYVLADSAGETIEQSLLRQWPHKSDNIGITKLFADETAKHELREEAEAQEQERIATAALRKAGKL